MEYEQTDIELEIGGILDRLGSELQAASKRLRTAPYVEIEGFLKQTRRTLERVDIAATMVTLPPPEGRGFSY